MANNSPGLTTEAMDVATGSSYPVESKVASQSEALHSKIDFTFGETWTPDDLDELDGLVWNDDEPEEFYANYYPEGGLHPVRIGDQLADGRYTIFHKLGRGSFSTVWLARDEKTNCNVAIKITGGHFTKSSNEPDVLKFIASSRIPQAGREYLQALLHHFVHQGPNGIHSCLPGNVILAHPDQTFTTQTIEEVYKSYDRPLKIPLRLCQAATLKKPAIPDNAPPYIVASLYPAGGFDSVELSEAEVIISDFSESWRPSQETKYELTTWPPSRAPESLFGTALNLAMDRPSDVWSLGCLVYRLFGMRAILGPVHYDPKVNFSRTVGMLGKPPQQWWDLMEKKEGPDDDAGDNDVAHTVSNETEPIDESKASVKRRVMVWLKEDRGSDMADDELEDLVSLLESVFQWLPNDRATASDLLSSPWMRKWGIPAMEGMKKERGEKHKEGAKAFNST
ncbi:Serine/threonine-protein kinase SRPK [Colletotrichum sp. SAR 10_99]|nr:Serine/threonine-protein kinase SRPK [Colletotrichum sp. SAR 10_99]